MFKPTFHALIPARKGSKGLPGKNRYPLAGKPLIAYTMHAAQCSNYINDIHISSDDEDILALTNDNQCIALHRPAHIAQDTTSMAPVIEHFIETCHISSSSFIVLLQPTSPLRTQEHIDQSIALMLQNNHDAVISVTDIDGHHPYKALKVSDEGKLTGLVNDQAPFSRRQDCPTCYFANGAIYVFRCDRFMEEKQIPLRDACPYAMPIEKSIDIDTRQDVHHVEELIQHEPND